MGISISAKRQIGYAVLALVVLGVAFFAVVSGEAASKYAAKVNGVAIKTEAVEAAVNNFIENQKTLGIEAKDEEKDKLKKDLLERLITFELLYQESDKAGLGDLTKEIDEQFQNIKNGLGSKEEYEKNLKKIEKSEKDLKEQVKKGVYIEAFLERNVYNNISVTEDDKKQEYENNKDKLNMPDYIRAGHILIRIEPNATEDAKKDARNKIDEIRQKALSGEDFAELAKANSQDGTAPNGGDLGYFKRGDMVQPFEDAAFALEVGQMSDLVETQFGYHIIKVIDKKPAHTLTYEEVEKDIESFLVNKRRQEALNKYIDGIRAKAKIERF